MAEQQKAKAKGRKIGRNKKHQAALYKSGARYEINKKRKMRRHIKSNPTDWQNAARYGQLFGGTASFGRTRKGRKLEEIFRAREKLRA
jgi:hypothetical protein